MTKSKNRKWKDSDHDPDFEIEIDKLIEILEKHKAEGFTQVKFDAGYNNIDMMVK